MEENIARLKTASELIREERRKYNKLLVEVVEGREEYNSEDLMRLVGTLEAAYNHALASIASDGDVYCLVKHLSYAIILVGELEKPDVQPLYDILAIITDGRVEPCSACKQDAKERSKDGTNNQDADERES